MALTTKLNAVNYMLRRIGEQPVSEIDGGVSEASVAEDVLDEVSQEVQSTGLECNTEIDVELAVDVNGNINIPTNALALDPMDNSHQWVKRGTKMYDKKNHTLDISENYSDSTYKFKVVYELDYEDLPETVRNYIKIRATRRYVSDVLGDVNLAGLTEQDEMVAKFNMEREQVDVGEFNMLTDSYSVNQVVARNYNPIVGILT